MALSTGSRRCAKGKDIISKSAIFFMVAVTSGYGYHNAKKLICDHQL